MEMSLWFCHLIRNLTNRAGLCEKGTLMHLRKVSTHVSLRSPRRLTWAETFGYF